MVIRGYLILSLNIRLLVIACRPFCSILFYRPSSPFVLPYIPIYISYNTSFPRGLVNTGSWGHANRLVLTQ